MARGWETLKATELATKTVYQTGLELANCWEQMSATQMEQMWAEQLGALSGVLRARQWGCYSEQVLVVAWVIESG